MYKSSLSLLFILVLASFILFYPSQAAGAGLRCRYNNQVFAQEKAGVFLGGLPPRVIGAFTHESKKLELYAGQHTRRRPHLRYIDDFYKKKFRNISYRGQKKWSEREKQPYQIYIVFRRVSFDNGANRTWAIKCNRAKDLFFDNPKLQDVRPLGDIVNALGVNEPFQLDVEYTYKVEFKRKNESSFKENTNAFLGPKMRVQHPDNPKKLVIEAIHTTDGMEPGDYEFKVTAEARWKCKGSSFAGDYLDTIYCSPGKLLERFLPGGVLQKLPPIKWGIDKVRDWAEHQAVSLVVYDMHQAATINTIPVLVTVPKKGVIGEYKHDAIKQLERRYLKAGDSEHIPTNDSTKHMKVANTNPGPFKDVPRGKAVNLIIKFEQDYLENYLKFLRKGKGK
jgi:hypothetical protein